MANLDLADSALNAPGAGFGDDDPYQDFVDKCGVLIVRLARNHPLPDGNKRASWVALRLFIELNGWQWVARPSVDERGSVRSWRRGRRNERGRSRCMAEGPD